MTEPVLRFEQLIKLCWKDYGLTAVLLVESGTEGTSADGNEREGFYEQCDLSKDPELPGA